MRRLLTLQGAMQPDGIVSLMSYTRQPTALSLPDHANRIQVTYTPLDGQNRKLSGELAGVLTAGQWMKLINRLSRLSEPVVPSAPTAYAIPAGSWSGGRASETRAGRKTE